MLCCVNVRGGGDAENRTGPAVDQNGDGFLIVVLRR